MTASNVISRNAITQYCNYLPKILNTPRLYSAQSCSEPKHPAPVVDKERAALYVHWPYCKRRCSYCNFNKYISNNVNHERMRKCLQAEATTLLRDSPVREITSVFFGGGTPSLAEPKTLEAVLQTVSREVYLAPESEISMEINPTSIETIKMKDFQMAGINRASIGIQTLNDNALRSLGRNHSSKDSLRCLERASDIFQNRTSVDLMFGYPGQSLDMWKTELSVMLPLCDGHISLYQLTLERGTQLFKDVAAGLTVMPSADELADMYFAAIETLESRGFEQYEVSNFSKEGNRCQQNIAYWTGQQYIGIGPGSHGRVWKRMEDGTYQRHACVQTLEPENWMWEVEKFGHATRKSTIQTNKDILEELVAVSLRTAWGLLEENWSAVATSVPLEELLNAPYTARWIEKGCLRKYDGGLKATPSGLVILDSILPDILVDTDTLIIPHLPNNADNEDPLNTW